MLASAGRGTGDTVNMLDEMRDKPWAFGFYSAIRRIENMHPDKPPVGRAALPSAEPVRLGQDPDLAFAPSTLSRVDTTNPIPTIISQFLGVFGPQGPLPLHLTEFAYDRMKNENDPTFARFMDLFHHRILVLFYRAWSNSQPVVQFDRPDYDRTQAYLRSFAGLGTDDYTGRDNFSDLSKTRHVGLFAHQRKDGESLEIILASHFAVPAHIDQFQGQWLPVPADSRCLLGTDPLVCSLGVSTTVGKRVFSAGHKFTIRLGPLDYESFERFIPGEDSLDALTAAVRLYTNDEFDWDLRLVLKAPEVPPARLGVQGRLGWTTWLNKNDRIEDAHDTVIHPDLDRAIAV
jgi:type VI secretion system protein ImpH